MIDLPKKIYFPAMKKHWKISYLHTPGKLTLIEFPYNRLVIYGRRYSKRSALLMLNKWVHLKAKDYLGALLVRLNSKIKAQYRKLRIHSLKTEWGSCSSTKILGLHYKLIFLPPALVKHIIIHELCHLKHLDHSPAFWKELAKFDKNWMRHKKAIDTAEKHVPEWLIF